MSSVPIEGTVGAVIQGGYCVGCGACAFATPDSYRQEFRPEGWYLPRQQGPVAADAAARAASVCPFTSASEDSIAERLYPQLSAHPAIGRHAATFAGHVTDDRSREERSSGGLGTWLATRLLDSGEVDGVVHVLPVEANPVEANPGEPIFRYAISRTGEELRRGRKSRYYPVEISEVLQEVAHAPPQRLAYVGVPCMIKALHLVAAQDPVIAQSIRATISIVCGHMKSAGFAQYLGWQGGIRPEELSTIDFRHKLPDRKASAYAFRAEARDGTEVVRPMSETDGGNWGLGYFKLKACDYCDDVVGETADISIGDAWLPQYIDDWRGTNVIVARSPQMQRLLQSGIDDGSLQLNRISPDEVAQSQDAGLRHRREGLAWRLRKATRAGIWAPPRRVQPAVLVNPKRRQQLDLRVELAAESHAAFADARRTGEIALFRRRMQPLVHRYNRSMHYSFADRIREKLWKWFRL
ncbi:Coenzyme F420 hydrogenase/dehydrogenase, beta subunit C-terminal domain [Sandaracinobacteroides hominis]|uniref:Coenzyme F420 hydrogenase/dehydrogenase, beta subunit C-terminal domain n=1 Tax=Sandaracinobacteroides hominis TaxID=2780086 RepID=UPI0018F7AE82|nr:Coenzyme F420 hydrogenase/dehydrogenase, beta subunit C-terminal domain [Sandaracinobacteroides hominis]